MAQMCLSSEFSADKPSELRRLLLTAAGSGLTVTAGDRKGPLYAVCTGRFQHIAALSSYARWLCVPFPFFFFYFTNSRA